MFDPDQAIKSSKYDELDRFEFAKSLGEAIINYESQESLVIGLLGRWGYGKTSIINMAIEHITEITKEYNNPPIIIKFNPWNFSQQNQLIFQFFNELIITLEKHHLNKVIIKKLKSYASKLTISSAVVIGGLIRPSTTKIYLDYFKSDKTEDKTLDDLKNDLNDLITSSNHEIIIIIDDIDRLSDIEVQQIFQLVKLLANFPNTIYLLSFDRKVVINALKNVQKDSPKNYLEKIIQIPFDIPKIHKEDIERLLFNQINEVIFEERDRFDENHWQNLYYSGLKYFFRNIRDVKRYSNTLKFNFQLIKNEVNIVDFLTITCIQIFEPNVYHGIRDNKDLFAGIFDFNVAGISTNPKQEKAKERCDKIIMNANESLREPLQSLLIHLFPKLDALYNNTNYGNDWLNEWRKELRLCSPDIFDIYFKFSLPKNELPHGRIESILSLSDDVDLLKESILDINAEGKIVKFLDRLEDYTSEIQEIKIGNIILVLMDIGDLLDDGYAGMLKPDTQMRILRIVHQLIFRFDSQDKRFEILEFVIKNTKLSIYPITHEIIAQDRAHGKYGLAERPLKPEERRTVNSEQLVHLENIVCGKILEWAERGELLKNRNLDNILFIWQKWTSEKEVNYFIKSAIEDDKYLIQFVTGFTEKTSNWNLSNNLEKVYWRINLKFMENFLDPMELKPRIKEISSKNLDMTDNNKRAIELFLKHIEY